MADDEQVAEDEDDFAGDDEDDEEPDELADGPLEEDLDDDEAVFDPDLAEEAEESLEVADVAVDADAEETPVDAVPDEATRHYWRRSDDDILYRPSRRPRSPRRAWRDRITSRG